MNAYILAVFLSLSMSCNSDDQEYLSVCLCKIPSVHRERRRRDDEGPSLTLILRESLVKGADGISDWAGEKLEATRDEVHFSSNTRFD